MYWVCHHLLFDLIRKADRGLMWINLFFLLFVAVIPFSTARLGRYYNNYVAILVYGGNIIAVGLSLQTLWTYATRGHRLIDAGLPAHTIRLGTVRLLAVPAIGTVSMLIALANAPLGMSVYVACLVAYSWPGRWTPYWSVGAEPPKPGDR